MMTEDELLGLSRAYDTLWARGQYDLADRIADFVNEYDIADDEPRTAPPLGAATCRRMAGRATGGTYSARSAAQRTPLS